MFLHFTSLSAGFEPAQRSSLDFMSSSLTTQPSQLSLSSVSSLTLLMLYPSFLPFSICPFSNHTSSSFPIFLFSYSSFFRYPWSNFVHWCLTPLTPHSGFSIFSWFSSSLPLLSINPPVSLSLSSLSIHLIPSHAWQKTDEGFEDLPHAGLVF